MSESANLAKQYQHKDARTHIYDTPDTYIGAVEEDDKTDWVLNENVKYAYTVNLFSLQKKINLI